MSIKNLGRVTGLSTYEIWLKQGNEGTEQDFLDSLKANQNSNYTLMIGDSYAEGVNPSGTVTGWCERTKELLGLCDDEFFKLYEGGAGFVQKGHGGHTFLTLLQENISKYNTSNINNIILCAGYNDYAQAFADIQLAIKAFIEYCKSNFPNARIYLGMLGNNGELSTTAKTLRNNIATKVLPAYKQCVNYGATYLNGVENILKYYPYISTDNIHPTEDGYQALAIGISEAFKNGSYEFMTETRSVQSTHGLYVDYEIKGDYVTIRTRAALEDFTYIKYSTPQTVREKFDLGKVDISVFHLTNNHFPNIPCEYVCMDSSNKYYGGKGFIKFDENNHAILTCRYLPNNGEAYPTFSNIIEIWLFENGQVIPTRYC